MNTITLLIGIIIAAGFLTMIFFVLFGQITVRKLRKNPNTKQSLGIEFASGWDILNVAGALALPRFLNRKLRNTPFTALYADAELLDKHTHLFDKILAIVFYSLFVFTGFSAIVVGILDILDILN